jgi:site-specific recombinase XerD
MNTSVLQNKEISLDFYQTDDLRDWIELFLHACRSRNLAAGTIEFYVKKLNAFILFCSDIAIADVSQITPETIRHFLMYLEEREHQPGGIHCYYRTLRTFLKWYAQETERADWRNPIDKVRAPIVPLEPLDPVRVDTIRSMIKAEAGTDLTNARDKASLLFLLDTGTRLAEFLALNREDVNMITGAVQIRHGKGRKPRNVYMGDRTRQALKRYLRARKDSNPALWVGISGERLTETGLRMMLRRRATRAGVLVPSPHDFRRAFALERWRAGTDIVTLSKLMGHTSLQVLNRYLKQAGEDLEQAARATSPVDLNF